jgi:hypothetical protein
VSKPADAIADWQDGADTFYARKGTADELPLFRHDIDADKRLYLLPGV